MSSPEPKISDFTKNYSADVALYAERLSDLNWLADKAPAYYGLNSVAILGSGVISSGLMLWFFPNTNGLIAASLCMVVSSVAGFLSYVSSHPYFLVYVVASDLKDEAELDEEQVAFATLALSRWRKAWYAWKKEQSK